MLPAEMQMARLALIEANTPEMSCRRMFRTTSMPQR
ncbi:hypothetical protein ACVWWW_001352 [Lysobacter sp. HA18]